MKKYIVSNPEILGGMPVVTGTRIPVSQLVFLLKEEYTIDNIHEFYPQLSKKTIEKTIEEAAQLINNASKIL